MTQELLGKPVASKIYTEIKEQLAEYPFTPKLAIILIGHDPASEFYAQNLVKKGKKVGIEVQKLLYDSQVSESEILDKISELNLDKHVYGIIVQKPLPQHFDESALNLAIDPFKDVDAFHPVNIGNMVLEQAGFIPSTPAAVLEMIRYYKIETNSKHVVILGRSNVVGKPLANLLIRKNETGNATVTVCHSRTASLSEVTKTADILVAAIGQPEFVTAEMIKKNCVIIDVGVNRIITDTGAKKYVGDVDYQKCYEKSSMITPVPGGVGSVTTAMLLKNILKSIKMTYER